MESTAHSTTTYDMLIDALATLVADSIEHDQPGANADGNDTIEEDT